MKGKAFSETEFRAVIEGRKTMTREVMKPQPTTMTSFLRNETWICKSDTDNAKIKPRYKVGETVYLKEPYRITEPSSRHVLTGLKYSKWGNYVDILKHKSLSDASKWIEKRFKEQSKSKNGYCSKMFMPEWCAKYFIEITGVKVERLQDISDEDCGKEGIFEYEFGFFSGSANGLPHETSGIAFCSGDGTMHETTKQAYAALFDSINGKGTWDSSPFVWVYEFKLVNNNK